MRGNGTHTDEQGRLAARKANFTRSISVNPQHVVSVEPVPSQIIEGSDSSVALSRVVTTMGSHVVVGHHTAVENKLLGDKQRILKG